MNAYYIEWTITEPNGVHFGHTYGFCNTAVNYHVLRYFAKMLRMHWCCENGVALKGTRCTCEAKPVYGAHTMSELRQAVPSEADADLIYNSCIIEPIGRTFECRLLVNGRYL